MSDIKLGSHVGMAGKEMYVIHRCATEYKKKRNK